MKSAVADLELDEETQKGKFLTFKIGEEDYGIDIEYATEIIGIQTITEVPEMPDYIKGIINLRGKIIPVMDARLRFKKESCPYNDRTCIIVIAIQNLSVGLIIDAVSEVIDIPEQDIVSPPQISGEYQHHYIKGIGKVGNEVKLLLDCEKMLSQGETENLFSLSES